MTEVDWESAEVHDGKLTVKLTPAPEKEWRKRAERAAELLVERGRSRWGELSVKKDELRIEGVAEGDEGDVRHFLEGVVLEANSAPREDDDHGEDEEESDSPDSRMTEAFRRFG